MHNQYDEIRDVKNRVFDSSLLVGTVVGVLTFALSLRNFHESSIKINYFLNLLTIFIFFSVYLFRNKLSDKTKSLAVIIGIIILAFADIYKLGAYSTAKMLLVLIPFFALLAFKQKRLIYLSSLVITVYILFSLLYTTETITTEISLNERNTRFSSWMVNLTILIIVAYAIITIVTLFNKAFYELIRRLEEQNTELKAHREHLKEQVAERTKELENANEELSTANEELYQSKNIIETQNMELKATLDHLKETQSKLVQSEKMASLGVLSAGVAHEINNPLNFIMGGYVGLIDQCKNHEANENIAFYLNSIKAGVDRSKQIVTALNHFCRDIENYTEKCDIHTIIDNCLIILSNQLANGIEINKQYCTTPCIVMGCTSKLHQVILNILSNAIQAIDEKGTITIITKLNSESIEIQIIDTGCGIIEENIKRVTDPFFTTKDPGKGIGLGLSIAHASIIKHNGELTINSLIGKGTTVTIILPLNKNEIL
jgi:C4-dicarboxylate-specific signal transduction histidine kinase